MKKTSTAYCCFAVLIVLLALLPGCGCGDDAQHEPLLANVSDPCAPPPVSAAGAVSFAESVKFLYDGACPRQTGVDKAVFDELRVSVVRGHVVDENGAALPGVRVRVPREARYGETRTRDDGSFDFVVNGGARTRLRFEVDGRLFAQRNADAKTNRFLVLDEIALVQKSANGLPLAFGGGGWQVATGDLSKDESAERRVRLLVPPGTKATAVKADGTRQPLDNGTLRITEFTRGVHGPAAMPSELPPASGYTYASSFLIDEAGPDAKVEFATPVIAYLDNFLAMKAGATVPSGALEEGDDGWKAQTSGRVVKLVSGASPTLDTNGDDVPDSPTELATLGITPEELTALAGAAPSGSYFRVTLNHFSAFDFNWAFGPPSDSVFPPAGEGGGFPDLPCLRKGGSYFECERQILGEDIALVGTDVGLSYHSDRVAGYHGNATFTVPVTDAVIPPSLKRAEVEVTVLGISETKTYTAAPNLNHVFTWSGLDAYGRAWPGETVAEVRVALVYDGVYVNTKSFGSYGDGQTITGDGTRREVFLNRRYEFRVGAFQQVGLGLGGWSLSAQHVYDPTSRTLYRGDGGRRNSDGIGANARAFAGIARYGSGGVDGPQVPAVAAHFGSLTGIAIDESGALYVAETAGAEDIRKIDKGNVTTFAGSGPAAHAGDGGPAAQAQINYPRGIVALRDGRVCFSEFYEDTIRCVGTDGIVRTIAGGGTKDLGADPVPALEAKLTRPGELAEGPDGSIFVTLSPINVVARIDRAGTIEIAVGGGLDSGENVPALTIDLSQPRGLAIAPDGTIFIAEAGRNRVRQVAPSGRVTTIAGTGEVGNAGDGGFATSATFHGPIALALDGEGGLYVSDHGNSRIRRVDRGKVQAFAGGGDRRSVSGAAARLASATVAGMVVGGDGTLYAVSEDDNTVLAFTAPFPGGSAADVLMPNEDGSELYVFDGRGKHLRTLDGLTSDVVTTFTANVTFPNGTIVDVTREADPRLGMLVPYAAKHVVTLPSGLARNDQQVWTAQQDSTGALVELRGERTSSDGRSTTVYDATMRVLTSTSVEGRVAKETLDGEGRIVRAEYPGRMPITFAYDERGRLATVDEGGRQTRAAYDPTSGALASVQNALGQTTVAERDGALRLTALVHADGAKSLVAWSAMDDPVGVTPPGKPQHTMTFGKDGNETSYTPPGNAPIAFGYDLDRALASVTREDGTTSSLAYDTAGRVTSVTYPGGQLGFTYDAKTSQLRTLTAPGSSLGLDYDGVLVRSIAATGPAPGTVSFTYDTMLRRSVEQVGTSSARYSYDRDGLVVGAGAITVGRDSATGLLSGIDVVNAGQRFTHTPFGLTIGLMSGVRLGRVDERAILLL